MTLVSEAQLLSHCIMKGLKRPEAVTLAHIAFFEQLEGGVEIGGMQWRYRTVAEIGVATGYSVRTITRALANLDEMGLIERKVIWDPRKHGPFRVNSFRLTKLARSTIEDVNAETPSRRDRTRRIGVHDAVGRSLSATPRSPERKRQAGSNIYRGQDSQQDTELFTLNPVQDERVFKFLEGTKPEKGTVLSYFDGYASTWHKFGPGSHQTVKAFWECLGNALYAEKGESLEPLDPVVSSQVREYLKLLSKERYHWVAPIEHGALALWAYLNWYNFAALVAKLKPKWPEGSRMNAWHLSKHGILIIDYFLKMLEENLDENGNLKIRKSNDYSTW